VGRQRTRLALTALSMGGAAFTLLLLGVGMSYGQFPIPGGDVRIWDRVGDALRSGGAVYDVVALHDGTFFWAPPWAVLWATLSWLPLEVVHALVVVAGVVSMRIMAGSWMGAGLLAWCPLVAFEFAGGNINLVIAASIALAVRNQPELAVVAAFAKLSPALAIDPRRWRRVVPVALVAIAITLPWLDLWRQWGMQLVNAFGQTIGPVISIPFLVRLPIGLILIATRRPSLRALGAVIAIPAFYYGSFVILLAPLAVAVTGWTKGRRSGG
jgi:hypothetical protein